MTASSQKLSFLEKAGYSGGDAAANFVFMTMILFQTNFYTDVFGLTASAAAAILLWPRLWDAVADPIVGILADRTKSRWGRFRPWILFTAVPWCVIMILAYTTPSGWSITSLIIYAVITNTMLMTLYSMNNMPYAALGGVMTGDVNERAKLNSFRFIAVNAAQFIVGGFTLPLVAKFSAGHDRQHGWQMTMMIWAFLCLALFLITFATTKERIQPVNKEKSSPKQDFANLLKNNPWKIMFGMTLVHFAILSFRGGALYNYYHHYADKGALYDWVQKLGLVVPANAPASGGILETLGYIVHGDRANLASSNVADVANSLINMLGTGVTIIVILLSPPLAKRFGKKAVAVVGFGLASLGSLAFYFLAPTSINGMVVWTVFIAIAYAPTIPLIWAIYADVADYSEWKTGRRFTGMVFATIGFGLKAGLALGSASFLWIMAGLFNYDTKLPDAAQAAQGFRACSGLVVGILFAVCTILLAAYQINKRMTIEMADELAERRETGGGLNLYYEIYTLQAVKSTKHQDPNTREHPNFKHQWVAGIASAGLKLKTWGFFGAWILVLGCSFSANVYAQATLKDVFKNDFRIGAALNEGEFTGANSNSVAIVKTQFDTISPENALKWESVHPQPGQFDFSLADRYVEFGVANKMFIIGHNLIWHSQTPHWVFEDAKGRPIDRTTLLQRMHEHIATVVGRYKGKIGGWDVVNEAVDEDGTLRDSPWRKIIGDDYLVRAFQFAHEADPAAELYYNDYSLENLPKRNGAIAVIKQLQAAGIPITAIGLQEHSTLVWPATNLVDETISDFTALGIKVMVTELDVDVLPPAAHSQISDVALHFTAEKRLNPYVHGLPDAIQQKLAQRYADLFSVFVSHRHQISRVTFWGVTDADSWLNGWPIRGRTSYPLLFDRDFQPKPAFAAIIKTAQSRPTLPADKNSLEILSASTSEKPKLVERKSAQN